MLLNVTGCRRCFPAIFSLATLCRHFLILLKFSSCLPFTLGGTLFSAAVLCGCSSNFFFQLGVLKHVSTSVTVDRGLAGVARTSVSFVIGSLSSGNVMQPFYWVCCELGAILSLLVYMATVCSGKVTLSCVCVCVYVCVYVCVCVCVCVCLRARFSRKSEYSDYCYLQSSSSSSSSYSLQDFRPDDLFQYHCQSSSLLRVVVGFVSHTVDFP